MLSIRGLAKPQYFWRPAQLIRRIGHEFRPVKSHETVQLPWKLPIEVNTVDVIGMAIAQQGLYDIVTTELVWRLAEPGEVALDVGANIGYFTSLLSVRVGTKGAVHSWEPHPKTFQALQNNVERWRTSANLASINLTNAALSNRADTAILAISEEANVGSAYISSHAAENSFTVQTELLSSSLDSTGPVGVMKLDVERHETQVLEGAGEHLRKGTIRDIVFEEHDPFPAPSHKILLDAGYRIFWFEEQLRGLKLLPPDGVSRRREYDLPPSYVATRDPGRLERLLADGGWRSF
jgi:FkbM family methyltransferase